MKLNASSKGFTLIELMLVLVILGFAVAILGLNGNKLFETMQYRSTIKDMASSLSATRYAAITSGEIRDVEVWPRERQIMMNGKLKELPTQINLEVLAAAELSNNGVGIIRFYPDGSSSGGSIEISRGNLNERNGVSLHVDWLVGRVSQQPLSEI